MYQDLKDLFGKEIPSVRKFKQKLSILSPEEQSFYRKTACEAAFCDWGIMNAHYRKFLSDLFKRDWQGTIEWFRTDTVLGTLSYQLREPQLFRKLLRLLEGRREKGEKVPSYIHLAFCCFLAFDYQGSLEYFGDLLRKECANTDELCELMDILKWTNESGCLDSQC